MPRWIGGLCLAACGSTTPTLSNVGSSAAPELGAFMTAGDGHSDDEENLLYVSAYQDHGQTVLGLLCYGPCLPTLRKSSRYKPDSYRSDTVRRVAPRIWEGTMRAEVPVAKSIKPATFTMRLDLSTQPPTVDFGGRQRELHRATLQKSAYLIMGDYADRQPMLFVNSTDPHEILIKPSPPADDHFDDTFLYLAPDNAKVQTVHSRNWTFRFARKLDPALLGAHFAVLHGELSLPQGAATFDLDEIRTPENDVSMAVTRAGKPPVRFQQTNDSNTHQYEHCTAGTCQLLLTAVDVATKCPNTDGRIAIWFDPAGTWRLFSIDDKSHLLDDRCKPAFDYTYVDETKVIVTQPGGAALEFTKRPATPE